MIKNILNIKENPFGLLLFAAIVLMLALVFRPTADIDLQDMTMFGVPLTIMVWIIPLLLISIWLLYLWTKNLLYSRSVTWIHVLVTVVATMLMVTVLYIGIYPSQTTTDQHEFIGNVMQMLTLLLVFGQILYFANVLLGLFDRQKAR
jgi:amino acid transporter